MRLFKSPFSPVKPPVVSLPSFLLNKVEKHPPNKAAYIDGRTGKVLTFAELQESVHTLQRSLYYKHGVRRGDTVAVFAGNSLDYPVIMLSLLNLGVTVTQGSPTSTEQDIRYHLLDSGAKFVVADTDILQKMPKLPQIEKVFSSSFDPTEVSSLAYLLEDAREFTGKPLPEVDLDPQEDVALLPYSSGTTGAPKGVCLTHHNIVSNLHQTDKAIVNPALSSPDIVNLALLPFHFIYGTMLMNHTLYSGQTSVILDTFYFKSVLRAMSDFKVNFAGLTPPLLHSLATNPLVDRYQPKIGTGGGPLNKVIAERVEQRLSCSVSQGYGMTEASPALVQPDAPVKHLSVGFPLPSTELRLIDREFDCDIESPNKWGSILVRGPQVMKGYHNDPKATDEVLSSDGWLTTGDVGYVDDEGYVFVVDREKDVIRYKGATPVSPSELERIIQQHPSVCDVVVVPSYNSHKEEIPKAYLVLSDESVGHENADVSEILDSLNSQVAPHKQIHHYEILPVLPRNHSGKVLRRELALKEKQRAGLLKE